jgi:hypothetical protein
MPAHYLRGTTSPGTTRATASAAPSTGVSVLDGTPTGGLIVSPIQWVEYEAIRHRMGSWTDSTRVSRVWAWQHRVPRRHPGRRCETGEAGRPAPWC